MCIPLAFVFSPVFSLMLALKMSPLEMCLSPKVLAMRPDTVPLPEPGGPMMTARISLCTTISTKQHQQLWTQLFLLRVLEARRKCFSAPEAPQQWASLGSHFGEEEEGKEEEKDEKPSVQPAINVNEQTYMIVLKEPPHFPPHTHCETFSSLIALLGMHLLYNTVM